MASTVIIFIPGNPSIPLVYSDFLDMLGHPVIELAHIGQNGEFNASQALINLKSNFKQHAIQLRSLIQQYAESKIILMGHSLGCSSILFHYQDFKAYIHQYILICPFIMPFKGNDWFIKLMAYRAINTTSKIIFNPLFKKPVGKYLLNLYCGEIHQSEHILKYLNNKEYFNNFLTLLASYQKFYYEYPLFKRIEEIPEDKLHLIFGQNDYWVPDEKRHQLPYLSKHTLLNMGHNFCLKPTEIKIIANYLKTIL